MYQQLPSAWDFHAATSYGAYGATPPVPSGISTAVPIELAPLTPAAPLDPRLTVRISCRNFSPVPLQTSAVAAVLATAYGELGEASANGVGFTHRPVPSAGAKYPLDVFLLARDVEGIPQGTYRYDTHEQQLEPVNARPDDEAMATIFLDQPYVALAPAIIILVGHLALTLEKYASRGYRYVLFEAGHVGQNIVLGATGLSLGALPIGGFLDGELAAALGVDVATAPPLYGFALGHPVSADPTAARSIP